MAGLGVFKHNSVAVIGLAADNSETVIIAKIQIFFIYLGHFFYGHNTLAGDNGNVQGVFQIFINGIFRNFRSQGSDYIF